MMMEIRLGRSEFVALVDDADSDLVKGMFWHIKNSTGRKYAVCSKYVGLIDGKQQIKQIYLHRLLVGPVEKGVVVDHINGNALDCRRENLRLCTHKQNITNGRIHRNKRSSKFKGVFKRPYSYCAKIWSDGREIGLGHFKSEIEAARAYDDAARLYHGAYARLNFPISSEQSAHSVFAHEIEGKTGRCEERILSP